MKMEEKAFLRFGVTEEKGKEWMGDEVGYGDRIYSERRMIKEARRKENNKISRNAAFK